MPNPALLAGPVQSSLLQKYPPGAHLARVDCWQSPLLASHGGSPTKLLAREPQK